MKNLKATKAILIARVSTEGQGEDDHHSIPAQLRNLRNYVERGGKFGELSLGNILGEHELRESAFQGERPEFAKIIENLDGDETVALVFDDIDRFARQVRSRLLIRLDELRKEGKIELHFVTSNLALTRDSSANETMVWNILLAVAEGQSKMISEKVKKGNKEKLEKGEFIGYCPTGYRNTKTQIGDNHFERKIEIDNDRAKLIEKCFELYATARYSTSKLVDIMNDAGFTTKPKKIRNGNNKLEEKTEERKVTRNDINTILRNPFYYGKFFREDPDTGKRALFPRIGLASNYKPLIDKNLFDLVQNVLDGNNTRINGYKKNNFKFRGLIECQLCGSTLTPEEMSRTYKGKEKNPLAKDAIYYHCSNGKKLVDPDFYEKKFGKDHSGVYISKKGSRKGEKVISCPQRWWKESEIEQEILEELELMHYDDSVYETIKSMLEKDYGERMKIADKEIRGLRSKHGKNESLIRAFTLKFATVTDKRLEEDMMKEYEILKEKQEKLMDDINFYEQTKQMDTDQVIDTMKLCCDLKAHYESLPIEKKRELLSICFSKIGVSSGEWRENNGKGKKVEGKGLYTILNEPFATLLDINLKEFAAQETDEKAELTKFADLKASPFP